MFVGMLQSFRFSFFETRVRAITKKTWKNTYSETCKGFCENDAEIGIFHRNLAEICKKCAENFLDAVARKKYRPAIALSDLA